MKAFLFDTETTGLIVKRGHYSHERQPEIVQIAGMLVDEHRVYASINLIIKCTIPIPPESSAVHGITDDISAKFGVSRRAALSIFHALVKEADLLVCHNYGFDSVAVKAMYHREGVPVPDMENNFCTMLATTDICKIPSAWKANEFKWPKLEEAYKLLIDPEGFEGAHDAMNDVRATQRVFQWLVDNGRVPGFEKTSEA